MQNRRTFVLYVAVFVVLAVYMLGTASIGAPLAGIAQHSERVL
jgi:hypothetical protein